MTQNPFLHPNSTEFQEMGILVDGNYNLGSQTYDWGSFDSISIVPIN